MLSNQKTINDTITPAVDTETAFFTQARQSMVDGQIRPNKVTNPFLLDRLESIPRELFTDAHNRALAYTETGCAIAPDRLLLAPTMFARMLEALDLKPNDTVLVLGGGSGYGTAIVTGLVRHVTMVESDSKLAQRAEAAFATLGITNQTICVGQIDRHAPDTYSAILIEGAVAQLPDAVVSQLAPGGRLVGIVGGSDTQFAKVVLATKQHDTVSTVTLFEASAPYLPGCKPRQNFTF